MGVGKFLFKQKGLIVGLSSSFHVVAIAGADGEVVTFTREESILLLMYFRQKGLFEFQFS